MVHLLVMMDYIGCLLTYYDNFAMSFFFSEIKVWEENNIRWATAKLIPSELVQIALLKNINPCKI